MDLTPCLPGQHTFRRTDDTNEPIGRCIRCEVTLDYAEREWEAAEEECCDVDEPALTEDEPEPTEEQRQTWAQRDYERAMA